jgi:hypothetical protein
MKKLIVIVAVLVSGIVFSQEHESYNSNDLGIVVPLNSDYIHVAQFFDIIKAKYSVNGYVIKSIVWNDTTTFVSDVIIEIYSEDSEMSFGAWLNEINDSFKVNKLEQFYFDSSH